ncbi:transcriptional regulator with XRE-family HTH domain [Kitasatospora sp. MAP5-34]|nr:transcriptional regulator with XRE-family HTH domain [Kitasatospora sp. MAP5-34]
MRRTTLDPTSSPAAAFGVQLRRSREAKKLTQVAFGALIGFSDSFVSCVERATRNPTYPFATLSDDALDTGGTLELMWWNLKHTALLEGFPEYAAHESKAAELRLFELGVIPGLFQTPAYAAAIASAAVQRGAVTQDQADERLAFLAARQRLLEQSPAPLVHAVLDESCLRRPIGGRVVLTEQFQHLELLAARPQVIIQVAPHALAERRPFAHPVTLLTLRDHTALGYTESHQRGFIERDTDTVRAWTRDYHRLQVEALPQAASMEMIQEVRKELFP